MFTTLKFATDANSPKGFTGVCVGGCVPVLVCGCVCLGVSIMKSVCVQYCYFTSESLFFVCMSVGVSIHHRERGLRALPYR